MTAAAASAEAALAAVEHASSPAAEREALDVAATTHAAYGRWRTRLLPQWRHALARSSSTPTSGTSTSSPSSLAPRPLPPPSPPRPCGALTQRPSTPTSAASAPAGRQTRRRSSKSWELCRPRLRRAPCAPSPPPPLLPLARRKSPRPRSLLPAAPPPPHLPLASMTSLLALVPRGLRVGRVARPPLHRGRHRRTPTGRLPPWLARSGSPLGVRASACTPNLTWGQLAGLWTQMGCVFRRASPMAGPRPVPVVTLLCCRLAACCQAG